MNIAGYSYSFFRQLEAGAIDTTTTIAYFAGLGLSSVELADVFIPESEHPRLKEALSQYHVAVACYDLHCDFVQRDERARSVQIMKVRRGLERAAEYEAQLVLVVPGESRDGIANEEARKWFAEGLVDCVETARTVGVTLTVPNLGYQAALFGASTDILATCDLVGPDLGVTYDVGNYLMAGENTLDALDRVAPRVRHVHLKDWVIGPPTDNCLLTGGYPGLDGRCYEGVALGDGIVDLPGAIARLRNIGYQGALSVEYEGTGDPQEASRRGVSHLRTLLAGVDLDPR